MKNDHNFFPPSCRVWIIFSHIDFDIIFPWLLLIDKCGHPFYITRIQCLVEHKIVEKVSSSISMKNYHNIFCPYFIVWILFTRIDFDLVYG